MSALVNRATCSGRIPRIDLIEHAGHGVRSQAGNEQCELGELLRQLRIKSTAAMRRYINFYYARVLFWLHLLCCAQVNEILHNPSTWVCAKTGTTDDLWVCLGSAMVSRVEHEEIEFITCSLLIRCGCYRSCRAGRWPKALPTTTRKKQATCSL